MYHMIKIRKPTLIASMLIAILLLSGLFYANAEASTKKTTAYTSNAYTYVRKKPVKGKYGVKNPIPYKSKITLYGTPGKAKKSGWVKLKYNKKTYYIYVKKGETYFTKKGLNYDAYTNLESTLLKQRAVDTALSIFRTRKTVYSHAKPGAVKNGKMQFDCSGFVAYAAESALKPYVPNVKIPNNINELYKADWIYTDAGGAVSITTVCTKKIDFNKLQPGDMLCFKENKSSKTACDHVGIYIGNKEFIHSTKLTNGVSIMPLNKGPYKQRFVCAKRILPNSEPEAINETRILKSTASVFSDLSLKSECDMLTAGTEVTVKYIAPARWTADYDIAYIEYGEGKTAFIRSTKF